MGSFGELMLDRVHECNLRGCLLNMEKKEEERNSVGQGTRMGSGCFP